MQFDFRPEDIHSDLSRRFYKLWLSKNAEVSYLPSLSAFSEEELAPFRHQMFIFEVHRNPLRFKVIFSGSANNEKLGFDATGQFMEDIPDAHRGIPRFERAVLEEKPYIAKVPLYWAGKEHKYFHVLQVPLSNNGRELDTMIFINQYP
ncbi:hypothetical protein [Kordiimonas sediminis]|nr:hypothetical protein [Kordiimonas sediminis]